MQSRSARWLRALLFLVFTGSFCFFAFAQGPQRPATTRTDLLRQREEWFYQQRAYPLGRIPAGARSNALDQFNRILAEEGRRPVRPTALAPDADGSAAVTASPTQWTPIGPQPTVVSSSVAQASGRIAALAVDPRNSNVVYLGAAQGGIWKTTDGGANWIPLTDTQPSLAIGSIALDPSNPDIVYVGTGEQNFSADSYYGAGVLKSTDGGANWTQLGASTFVGPYSSTLGGARIGSLAVHPTNGQIVLAGVRIFDNASTPGIYRSSNGGTNWTNVLSGAAATSVVFDPTNGNIAYAALGRFTSTASVNGVYKSADAGATWARADAAGTNKLPTTNLGRIAVAIAPSSPSTLYASIANGSDSSLLGLFKSVDGGVNWTQLVNTPPYCITQCNYDNVVGVSPTSANIVFVGGQALNAFLFRSLDGGSTWTEISTGANGASLHVDMHALAFSNTGAKLYAGNDGGVWSTSDVAVAPVNWTNLNATLAITQFYPGLSIHPTNVNTGFGGAQDNGTQRYAGNLPWNAVTCGDGGWTAIDSGQTTTVYTACQRIDIRKSTTSGDVGTWLSADSGIDTTDRVPFIPPFVIDPSLPLRLYFGTFRVWQTIDGAGSWAAISPDLTASTTGTVTTIAVAPSDSNTVYAGTSDAQVQVTTNAGAGAGATWTNRSTGLAPRFVTQIAVDRTNSLIAYVTFSGFSGFITGDTKGHVFKTTGGGANWTDISGNLPNIPVNDIVIDPDLANTLYAATDLGVFRTSDGGATWSTLVTGLPRVAVLGLKLHRPSRTLRSATHGRSMWDLIVPLPALTISAVTAASITSSGATITWTTDTAADSQVEYGLTTAYGSQTTLNPSLVTSHSVPLSGLTANTLYHYRVKSRDAAGTLATSDDFTFTTSPSVSSYLVGDVAPLQTDLNGDGDRDDVGEFGDGILNNLDLIQALRAVVNLSRPPSCSDRYDAMDAVTADTDTARGGDTLLNNQDLIRTLRRVVNLDTSRPLRPSRGISPCP